MYPRLSTRTSSVCSTRLPTGCGPYRWTGSGGMNQATSFGSVASEMSYTRSPALKYVRYTSVSEEDHEARRAERNVRQVPLHVRRPVQRHAGHGLLAARYPLARDPPAARLGWMRGIAVVDDHVDVPAVAGHAGGEMDVLAAEVAVAMRPRTARLVLAEELRVDRIGEAPDQYAFVIWLGRVAAPSGGNALERGDHLPFLDVHLDGPGVRGPGDEGHHLRVARVGHIHDRPAAIPQVAHVQEPAAVHLMNGELEWGPAVHLRVAHHSHVAGRPRARSEEHTSELQSQFHLV